MIDDLTRNILEQRTNIENQNNRILNSNREHYIKQLEQRIDKAIKYIEEEGEHTDCSGEPIYYLDEEQEEELLEILKGENNE